MRPPTLALEHSSPPSSSPDSDRGRRRDELASFSRQLGVIPEMLSSLDTVTTAGQGHFMSKIVSFIQGQAGRAGSGLSVGNRRMFAELLGHQTRESERRLPDVRTFSDRTHGLVSLLGRHYLTSEATGRRMVVSRSERRPSCLMSVRGHRIRTGASHARRMRDHKAGPVRTLFQAG